MKLICCFIPDDQQAAAHAGRQFKSCQAEAEWEIYGRDTAPHLGTHACTEHVGELLNEGENRLFPVDQPA